MAVPQVFRGPPDKLVVVGPESGGPHPVYLGLKADCAVSRLPASQADEGEGPGEAVAPLAQMGTERSST